MDLDTFLKSRHPRWQRLSQLLDRIEKLGLGGLTAEETDEFFRLYRLTSSDLNLVQTRTANSAVLDYLEGLVGRAYGNLSVPRRASFLKSWWMILRHYFPAAIRAELPMLLLSLAMLSGGVLFGFAATMLSPRAAEVFLPTEHLSETPAERVARLEKEERDGRPPIDSLDKHGLFTVFLFNNNIRVSVLAFALGLSFGIGTAVILFYNGAMLGSLAALYLADGVMVFFVAWIGPHGSIELPCVVFAGTSGFLLARTQLRQGHGSVAAQIRKIRPRLVDIIVGTATLLVVAGFVEGGFSQINEPTLPYWLKISAAVALLTTLLAYLFWIPVKPRPAEEV
jgi:uncharacterized membrane protein SpoIIM required for sporulation